MSIISKELHSQLCRGIFSNVTCKFVEVNMVVSCYCLFVFCGLLWLLKFFI
jgi:hypothetical protein